MLVDCFVFCVVVVVSVVFFYAINLTLLFNQHTFFIHRYIYNTIVVVVSANIIVVVVVVVVNASLSAATAALSSLFVISVFGHLPILSKKDDQNVRLRFKSC